MFVTCRGEGGARPALWKVPGFRRSSGAGVCVLDVSLPRAPQMLSWWGAPNRVEGQDRLGSLLVVCNVADGIVYTFDADAVAAGPVGACNLSVNGCLHVRLHSPADGHIYALVTSGFATAYGVPGGASCLVVLDVTDASRPLELLKVREGAPRIPEGIFVHGTHAYIGGCADTRLSVYALGGLPSRVEYVRSLHDPAYKQLVCQDTRRGVRHADGEFALLYAALWAKPGGLGVFEVHSSGEITETSRLVCDDLTWANRVVMLGARCALLPLESHPGGFAVVSHEADGRCQLLARRVFTSADDTCYCACANGGYVYAFAVRSSTMHVFRFI